MNAEQFHKEIIDAANQLANASRIANARFAERLDAADKLSNDVPQALKLASLNEATAILEKEMEG